LATGEFIESNFLFANDFDHPNVYVDYQGTSLSLGFELNLSNLSGIEKFLLMDEKVSKLHGDE
jgi:hypothetical protein